jgi:hypothetical protein
MSTYLLRTLAAVTLFSAVLISSCKEDDPIKPVTIQFALESQSVAENAATPVTVTVQFDGAATKDGTVTVTINSLLATYGTHYTTNPAATSGSFVLNITKGQSAAQFTVTPVNNALLDGDKGIMFTLSNPSSGLQLGTRTSYILTITDDEGPTKANFAIGNDEVAEDAEEKIVTINLTSAAPGGGTIVVAFTSDNAVYGTHFTTDPAATDGKLTLAVGASATSVTFKVLPVDDEVANDNRVINFTIDETTGVIEKGTNLTFALTIVNDDAAFVAKTIAEVRAMFEGSPFTIEEPILISGVVISSNNNITIRNAWLHDGTAGILVRFNTDNTFARGDEVQVLVQGATLQTFNGTLQIGNNDLPNANAEKIGDGVLPDYVTVTIEQLNSHEYEGDLVKVVDVSFPAADGTRNLRFNAGGGAGNNEFTDGVSSSILKVESYAPFASDIIPLGSGDLFGIASQVSGTAQITPQTAADIFESNATAEIQVSVTNHDFGDVDNGVESAPFLYTVTGVDLTADVVITASAHYFITLDVNDPFTDEVTIPFATANVGVNVYVKFAPTSGADQTIPGTITHSSTGALEVVLNVSGNETGNSGPSPGGLILDTSPLLLNFDNLGTDGLPSGVYVRTAANATASGNDATPTNWNPFAWNNTSGAFKNFASATGLDASSDATAQSSSTNRALGIRQTASVGDPGGAFVFEINNTLGKTNFSMSFALQSLDASVGRTTTWSIDYAIGDAPVNFMQASPVGTMTTGPVFSNNTITVDLSTLDNTNAKIWIRIVTLSGTTGSGSRPSTGIDDVTFTWD